jgi:hypothetical protein
MQKKSSLVAGENSKFLIIEDVYTPPYPAGRAGAVHRYSLETLNFRFCIILANECLILLQQSKAILYY